jgi:DNA-directed RNA polymerase subunit L
VRRENHAKCDCLSSGAGRVTPAQALKTACEELQQVCNHIKTTFNDAQQ